jgi:hypothetical protein
MGRIGDSRNFNEKAIDRFMFNLDNLAIDVSESHVTLLYRNRIKHATEIAVRRTQMMTATRQNDFDSSPLFSLYEKV